MAHVKDFVSPNVPVTVPVEWSIVGAVHGLASQVPVVNEPDA